MPIKDELEQPPAHLEISQLARMSLSRNCGQAGVNRPDLVACHLIPVAKVNEHNLQARCQVQRKSSASNCQNQRFLAHRDFT